MAILRTTPGTIQDTPAGTIYVGPSGLVEVSRKWVAPLLEMGFEMVEEGEEPEQPNDIVKVKALAGKKTKRVMHSLTEVEEV